MWGGLSCSNECMLSADGGHSYVIAALSPGYKAKTARADRSLGFDCSLSGHAHVRMECFSLSGSRDHDLLLVSATRFALRRRRLASGGPTYLRNWRATS